MLLEGVLVLLSEGVLSEGVLSRYQRVCYQRVCCYFIRGYVIRGCVVVLLEGVILKSEDVSDRSTDRSMIDHVEVIVSLFVMQPEGK